MRAGHEDRIAGRLETCVGKNYVKEGCGMKDFMKLLLTVGCIAYIISPVDGVPGPVDDFAVLILTAALNSRKWSGGKKMINGGK